MRDIGLDYTWNYVQRFGFDKSQLPQDLTMALGTAELSPLQMATAYSTFANGGFKVNSYYIDRILGRRRQDAVPGAPLRGCPECGHASDDPPPAAAGRPAETAAGGRPNPQRRAGAARGQLDRGARDGKTADSCQGLAPQIISPQIAYLLSDMMADVIRHGTGQRALVLIATTSPARPAPPTTPTTPGSTASTGISWPRCGRVSTRTAPWATASRAPARRSRPGFSSCARRLPARRGSSFRRPTAS